MTPMGMGPFAESDGMEREIVLWQHEWRERERGRRA